MDYISNTPTELANNIALSFADFDTGSDGFQLAIDTARAEILFRLGQFDSNSYPEIDPFDDTKLAAAKTLAKQAEWNRAGAILYTLKAQLEVQFGESGTPLGTSDGFQIGAFTPEKDTLSHAYKKRGTELQTEYEQLMTMIIPNTNMPFVASASGRSDFTSDRTFWGKDEWT